METRHICRRALSSAAMIVTYTSWIACWESQGGSEERIDIADRLRDLGGPLMAWPNS